ncbi:hypothetical protein GH714_006434 [Hevea brasiliensis]|uniref:Uncharacterized protein n=1 Tax=Hevea brasiliensis TaxID=3981 RepID=A0A6A6N2M9_HEVBR|nr:hypothetical protein GH714_006434 [Hevea brasiliensis]
MVASGLHSDRGSMLFWLGDAKDKPKNTATVNREFMLDRTSTAFDWNFELEVLVDPMRKEVGFIRKRIDMANKELKPLGQSCQKKEKEYKEALEAFNEKNKGKAQLVTTLMELLTESERLRMKKLEELSKNVESKP